jgi:hypothetical protein
LAERRACNSGPLHRSQRPLFFSSQVKATRPRILASNSPSLPVASPPAERELTPQPRRGSAGLQQSLKSHAADKRARFQREKIPGGGASGKGVRNRIEAGGADCPSVSSGLVVSGDAEIDGFFGGSHNALRPLQFAR